MNVIDATDETFEQVVVQASAERPVIVDLWAAWCGPCRTLGPILEDETTKRDGAVSLVKIDVDHQQVGQALLQAVRSQSIPTVVAFRDGQIVDGFIGALPPAEVSRWVDGLLPSQAELEAKEASEAAASGDLASAEQGFREALADDPGNRDAAMGLAALLVDRGALEEAGPLVAAHLPDSEAERLHARIEIAGWSDEQARTTLGQAKALAAQGDMAAALSGMLAALAEDRDEARRAMVTVFDALGEEDPLVAEYRRRLAAELF